MNWNITTGFMLAVATAFSLSYGAQSGKQDQRPNILVIVTDDHAYQTLGSCEKDSPMPYPNFRKLADEGMVFDRS